MKHLIIDANNLLYRAHFVSKLTDKKGNRVSGIFNSMRMLGNLMKKFQPDSVVVVWDKGKSRARLAIFPDYKSQRAKNRKEEDVIDLQKQRELLQKIFSHLPVKQIQLEGVEADDIIGWLVTKKLKGKKIIVSNDTDFIQLVEKKVNLFLPNKANLLTPKNVDKHLGFPAKHYVLWKSLVGDNSDNIKGVHGIGPKKATGIVLNGLNENKKKLNISQEEQAILERNKYLIAIGAVLQDEDIKQIKTNYKKAKEQSGEVKFSKIRKIFKELNFKSLLYQFEEFEMRFKKLTRKETNGIRKEVKDKKEKVIKKDSIRKRKQKEKSKKIS